MSPHNNHNFKYCPYCATPLVMQTQQGETHPTCPNCGWVQYEDPKVAAGVLVMREHTVLLVRRVMQPFAGAWSLPAGFVNAFEDPARAAARECLEETGLIAEIGSLAEMLTGREHPRGADILLVYHATITGGELKAGDDASAARWFDLKDLPELAFKSTQQVLQKYLHS